MEQLLDFECQQVISIEKKLLMDKRMGINKKIRCVNKTFWVTKIIKKVLIQNCYE